MVTVVLLAWIIGGNLFIDGGVTKFFWIVVIWVVLAFIFTAVKGNKKAKLDNYLLNLLVKKRDGFSSISF